MRTKYLLLVPILTVLSVGVTGSPRLTTLPPQGSRSIANVANLQEGGQNAAHPHGAHVTSGGVVSLPLAVDGANTPERVPDALAYAHLLGTLAEREDAAPDRIRRRASLVARIGLPAQDTAAFVSALVNVREQLDEVHERRSAATPPTPTESGALQADEQRILAAARVRVDQALSSAALARLDLFVREQVKPRIKIYGAPPGAGEDD